MNISVCITVFNEERTITPLLDSLINQSEKADEIVIVDGGSTDKTVEIIRHYQKRYGGIKLLIEKCSRARGRNLSIEIAKKNIILMTDAGCVAGHDWLKNITEPFKTGKIDTVAGFYKMVGESNLQKAESVFLGVTPRKFNNSFLPSTRSVAFTKGIWEKAGGFPESTKGAAEDTIFNSRLIKSGAKISRMKNAIVEWGMPTTIKNFQLAIYNYAKGDVESKIWNFPGKGLMSHNIKVLSIFLRYLLALTFLILSIYLHISLTYWFICLFIYLAWAYRKVYLEFGDYKISLWGPVLQITSDIGVMFGFISGILDR